MSTQKKQEENLTEEQTTAIDGKKDVKSVKTDNSSPEVSLTQDSVALAGRTIDGTKDVKS